jgi:O-antigen ligase
MASASSPRKASHSSVRSDLAVRFRGNAGRSERSSPFPAWLLLTGILLIPSSLAVHLSGEEAKFTPGRFAIILLLVPAFSKLLREGRHLVLSDFFVFLTSAWMIGSRLQEDGLSGSAVAEVIELFGGYIVARAFFFGRPALQQFMRVFKILTVTLILLACLEPLAGRNVVTAITSMLFHTPEFYPQFRYGIVRAQSTLEDAEHFGTFCCVAGSLFLYSEPTEVRRLLWVGVCFFGCLLAISSGPLLAFALVVATFIYDRIFKQFSWRWKAYVMAIAGLTALPYVFAEHPTAWLIEHLTLDPSTGYFRLYVFDYAFDQIAQNPLFGLGFGQVGSDEFLGRTTIDSVWLVIALRFGIPAIAFLLLTNIGTFLLPAQRFKGKAIDPYINTLATGFTFGIVCFVTIGLTVHFWNATWMLWGVLLGTRASIKESQIYVANRQFPFRRVMRRR